MHRLSWSEAFGLSMVIMAVFLVVRTFVMAGNDLVLCSGQGKPLECLSAGGIAHLLLDDVGTRPR